MIRWWQSLRFKLVLSSIVVEGLMLTVLVSNNVNLIDAQLTQQEKQHLQSINPLLNSVLATSVAQRDYATLQDILEESQKTSNIAYFVLRDNEGRTIATAGRRLEATLPAQDASFAEAETTDRVFDSALPITFSAQHYGVLYYGMPVDFLIASKERLVKESFIIAAVEIGLSFILLLVLGHWITRHLQTLEKASQAVAQGNFNGKLHIPSRDEVGSLATAFNTMLNTIHKRIDDLNVSKEAQRRLLQQTQQEHAHLQALLAAMKVGVLFCDNKHVAGFCNQEFLNIWGLSSEKDIIGKEFATVIQQLPVSGPEQKEVTLPSGQVITQSWNYVLSPAGMTIGQLWLYEDVTQKRLLAYQAEHDPLTGLYNRHRLQEELARIIANVGRTKQSAALLYFDLDGFKLINDIHGHNAGDHILVTLAKEVEGLIRRNEYMFRVGGDEFAILLTEAGKQQAVSVANRVIKTIAQREYVFDGKIRHVAASIGIAFTPRHAQRAEDLIRCADVAMYKAKKSSGNGWVIYNEVDAAMQREEVLAPSPIS